MTQDWDEVEALRESLRQHMAEIKRLNECLTWEQHRAEHVSTHGPGCATWGPKHYECLLRAYNAMKERTSQESRQVEPVAWEYKDWRDGKWHRLIPQPGQTLEDALAIIRGYCIGNENLYEVRALYTAPPKREPLTEEEISALNLPPSGTATIRDMVRLIERAHGIGGEK